MVVICESMTGVNMARKTEKPALVVSGEQRAMLRT